MSKSSSHSLPQYNEQPPPHASRSLTPHPPDERPRGHTRAKSRLKVTGQQSITSENALLAVEQVAERHATSLTHGLHPSDATSRLHVQGPNELPHEEPEPLWLRFVKQFQETLILLLLASAAISAIMGNYEDAISIAVAVTIVVSVAFVQEYRSEKSLEALNQLVPHTAHVIRGNVSTGRSGQATTAQENGHAKGPGVSDFPAAEKASSDVSA